MSWKEKKKTDVCIYDSVDIYILFLHHRACVAAAAANIFVFLVVLRSTFRTSKYRHYVRHSLVSNVLFITTCCCVVNDIMIIIDTE